VVRSDPAPHVACITINRVAKRNFATGDALHDALAAALDDQEIRSIVLTGAGKVFSAGGDLNAIAGLGPTLAYQMMQQGHRIPRLLALASKPLVAAVEGWAVGIGASIAVMCDTIVAGESARFAFPFAKLGLVPDLGLMRTLAWRTGAARARELLLYARTVDARDALACGLVDEVVADDLVQQRALERAVELSELAPFALGVIKRFLAEPIDELLEREASAQAMCLQTDEFREGRAAILEGRPARF
jgi:enoyl-CoA hydratase/carnithine racemase